MGVFGRRRYVCVGFVVIVFWRSEFLFRFSLFYCKNDDIGIFFVGLLWCEFKVVSE